jgi:hypothetical protein
MDASTREVNASFASRDTANSLEEFTDAGFGIAKTALKVASKLAGVGA